VLELYRHVGEHEEYGLWWIEITHEHVYVLGVPKGLASTPDKAINWLAELRS